MTTDTTEPSPAKGSWCSRVSRALATIAGLTLLGMVLVIAADVTLRTLVNRPLPGTIEYVTFWFLPLTVLFGLALTESLDDHIRVTLLEGALRGQQHKAVVFTRRVTVLLVLAVMVWSGIQSAVHSVEINESTVLSAVSVAIWPVAIFAVIGWLWFALQTLIDLIGVARPSSLETSTASKEARRNLHDAHLPEIGSTD